MFQQHKKMLLASNAVKTDPTKNARSRSQFHQHLKHVFFVQIFCQSQNVTRKAAKTSYSYEKFVRLMLMKLTPSVNFISILLAAFMRKDPESAKKD